MKEIIKSVIEDFKKEQTCINKKHNNQNLKLNV